MKKLIYLAILAIGLSSCSDWFDTPPKENFLDEDRLFTKESAFRNAMNGIYTEIRSTGLYGDFLTLEGVEFMGQTFVPDEPLKPVADLKYDDDIVKSNIDNAWIAMYNSIQSCNNLLRIFDEKNQVVFIAGSKEMMIAELKALRAFLHYELVRLYNPSLAVDPAFKGVVWTDAKGSATVLSNKDICAKIESELTAALTQLKRYDPVVTKVHYDKDELLGTKVTARMWKMNYYAALAVKARVSLASATQDGYTDALAAAKEIIESGIVDFAASAGTDFAFSKEHLFGLSSPEKEKGGLQDLSTDLFIERHIKLSPVADMTSWASADPNDLRLRWFVTTDRSDMSVKYGEGSIVEGHLTAQRIPMIKLGEVYMIAAEAALGLNNTPTAFDYMKTFATKRFRVTSLTASSTVAQIESEIKTQYTREFLGEGQLFHFYKRKNLATIPSYNGGSVTMSAGKYTWPIPKS